MGGLRLQSRGIGASTESGKEWKFRICNSFWSLGEPTSAGLGRHSGMYSTKSSSHTDFRQNNIRSLDTKESRALRGIFIFCAPKAYLSCLILVQISGVECSLWLFQVFLVPRWRGLVGFLRLEVSGLS